MVFLPDEKFGRLAPVPDSIPISEFMLDERHGRVAHDDSRDPFTCGLTGKTYSSRQVASRVDQIARALADKLGWAPNHGTEWDKVIGVFSFNTIDIVPLAWGVHRLGGVVSAANAAYSAAELKHQLLDSGAKALFTCASLLPVALEAADQAQIPRSRVFLVDTPPDGNTISASADKTHFTLLSELIAHGASLPPLEPLRWAPGEGARRTAFLCYSSGTSGLPKGVKISHRNVIANVLQIATFEHKYRAGSKPSAGRRVFSEVGLGLLPQSHIYALVVICHAGPYRGDQVIVLPKFELKSYLGSIQKFKITSLFLVPPIIINMLRLRDDCSKYDLSSMKSIFTGAAPLGKETAEDFQKVYPKVIIRQGYGLTETCTVVCTTHFDDVVLGSSGCLLPGFKARVVTPEGEEITSYDTPGELVVSSPSIVLGYLNNETANKETFEDGWMRTGDEAVFRRGPKGTEHVFIVDRIKELIKVKGLQVAPAELEAHLLTHPAVTDCAVIAIPNDAAGEVPRAIVVKAPNAGSDSDAASAIAKYVEDHKARHKWLKGGVGFIDVIPKSPSGKILRRLLRDREKNSRRQNGAKM